MGCASLHPSYDSTHPYRTCRTREAMGCASLHPSYDSTHPYRTCRTREAMGCASLHPSYDSTHPYRTCRTREAMGCASLHPSYILLHIMPAFSVFVRTPKISLIWLIEHYHSSLIAEVSKRILCFSILAIRVGRERPSIFAARDLFPPLRFSASVMSMEEN